MMIFNLPKDLVEEILSRVPLKYLRSVRSTCKMGNALTKIRSFTNKHIDKEAESGEKEFLMITEFSVFLIGVNLHRTQNNNVDLSIKHKGKLKSLDSSDKVFYKSQVIHCNGLILCIYGNMLVVWNPYWGKTKWIIPRNIYGRLDMYALGYDNSSGSHKILRLFGKKRNNLEIYDLSSSSWMVPDGTIERDIEYMQLASLKGNTYWYARDKDSVDRYLFSFDFTRERFGPRLPLPFNEGNNNVSLYAVKEEQLAVLTQLWVTMHIWVTNKIEPDVVSWSKFLKVDLEPRLWYGNFLIDEEKKLAVVFVKDQAVRFKTIYNTAYIIGENGYLRRVDLSKSPYTPLCQLVCSYVPSSVQIK